MFMDRRMPVMDGLTASKQIWSEFGKGQIKIVVISASTLVHQQEEYLAEGLDAFISKPFRPQQIYDCLAELLHIEYEYQDAEVRSSSQIRQLVLPTDLRSHLVEAAELGNVTKLGTYLDEVRALGVGGHRLAETLHQFIENFDTQAVLDLLGAIDDE